MKNQILTAATLAVLSLSSSVSAHAMGRKLVNTSDAFDGATQPVQTVQLDKRQVNLSFERPIERNADPARSFILVRDSKTPNQVTLAVSETDPSGDSRCIERETKTYHGEDSSCGTGIRYVNDCRDERTCQEQVVTVPGQPPQTTTTCQTTHVCGVFPQAYTLTCDYTRDVCVNWEDVATTKSWTSTIAFSGLSPLATDQTEEYELVLTSVKHGSTLLRANRTRQDTRIKRVKKYEDSFRVTNAK